MRNNVKTARPVARKGEARSKKTVSVAVASTRKSQPIIQLVERRSSPALAAPEIVKKVGELPIPTATFVF
jgi:hypothetical protein